MDAGITVKPEPLLRCPVCKKAEMKLVGIERHNPTRDLFTFECVECRNLEARTVLLA